ncbi:DUF1740-domain-containing protein [Rickenella mellea]|uniref:DUF1740-domain-containing protein n=1 Tax=Rickenella mellea TaxID=50990 RepID=A0A4Y7QMW4_9AGAM|nr:DUF1740-domain-containing protein [Rickenella mellea]
MTAPSFSSFPPSFGSFPGDSQVRAVSSSGNDNLNDLDIRKSKNKVKDGHKRRSDRPSRKNSRSRSRRERETSPERRKSGTPGSDSAVHNNVGEDGRSGRGVFAFHTDSPGPSVIYYSDRKGDRLNIDFGGLYHGDVPKYNPVGRGKKILGLGQAWTVVFRSGKGVEVAMGGAGSTKQPQLTDRRTFALLTTGKSRRLLTSSTTASKFQEVDGFLPLPTRRNAEGNQTYRSITHNKDGESDSDYSSSNADAAGSSDDSDTTPFDPHLEALRALEQNLSSDPSDVTSWLTLMDHSLSNVPITSKNATQTRAEITLSVLARTIASAPENASNVYIRLKYLKAGEEIWHESKLRAEWEECLRAVNSPDIWMEWLDWRIRSCVGGVDQVVRDAVKALKSSGQGLPLIEAETAQLRIMWRMANFFKQAGFVERSTALFQAQAELSFNVPEPLTSLPFDQQLDNLEEFWESEAPRIGEVGARGWHSREGDGVALNPAQTSGKLTKGAHSSRAADPYIRWATQEADEDKNMSIPLKSTDDFSDDPYATILFSDIRPLLVSLQTTEAKDTFRLIWLSCLGLHIPGFTASLSGHNMDDRWSFKQFSTGSFLSDLFPKSSAPIITADSYTGVMVGREREYRKTFGIVKEWCFDALRPLDGVGLDESGRMWEQFEGDVEFVRRVFEQLKPKTDNVSWNILFLSFEASQSLKSAVKLSRNLLSVHRQSTELWTNHALLERIRGRYDESRKIYQTLLSSQEYTHAELVQVWYDYVELEWLSGNNNKALEIIMTATGQSSTGGNVQLLRAKRTLDENTRNTQQVTWRCRLGWCKMRLVLELLSGTMQGGIHIADEFFLSLNDGSVEHESLSMASLLLLYHHSVTLRNPSPPALLRAQVQKAVEKYPSNTIILGVFLECEKGEGVWGRVRDLLGDNSEGRFKEKSVARRVADVWIAGWQKGKWHSEIERVRNGLEAAVLSTRTGRSAILWKVYIEFETREGQLQKAKRLLYRAIGECPMVKELYLLAFGSLRTAFKASELNAIAETMVERGLRLRSGLEEVVVGWRESDDEGDSEREGELEYESKERRRLMPY